MKVRCFILSSICMAISAFAIGQETALDLEECIRIALENNPLLQSVQHEIHAADEDVASVKGKFYPEALARTGYRRWESHAFLPPGVGFPGIPPVIGPTNDWGLSLRSNYLVYDSGLRSSELKVAQAQRAATAEDFENAKLDVELQTRVTFYQLLASLEQEELARQRFVRSEDHLRLAEERKAAGAVPLADVTRVRAELANSKLSLVSAESEVRIARSNLNTVMGRQVDMAFEVKKDSLVVIPPKAFTPTDADWQLLTAERPDIKAARQRVEASKSQIGIVKSELLPRVRAEAGFGWRDSEFFPSDKDWYVGMTLDIPLFDGFTRKHRVAKETIEVSREEARLRHFMLQAQKEIWSAHSRMVEAFESIEASKALQKDASESARLTRERYAAGAGVINDLLDAEFLFAQSEVSTVRAEYHYLIAMAEWLRVTAGGAS
jgi:outer membrane protein